MGIPIKINHYWSNSIQALYPLFLHALIARIKVAGSPSPVPLVLLATPRLPSFSAGLVGHTVKHPHESWQTLNIMNFGYISLTIKSVVVHTIQDYFGWNAFVGDQLARYTQHSLHRCPLSSDIWPIWDTLHLQSGLALGGWLAASQKGQKVLFRHCQGHPQKITFPTSSI